MDSIWYYISWIVGYKLLIIILFITLLIYYLHFKLTFWKRQGIPNIILHNYKLFNNVMSEMDWNCIKTNGKVVGLYELLTPTLLIAEPKLISQVLIGNFKTFANRRELAFQDKPMGSGIFCLDYHSWKACRQLLNPILSMTGIKKISNIIEDSVYVFINNLEKHAMSGESFNIKPYFESLTLDIALRGFFGAEINFNNTSTNPMVINLRRILKKDISLEQLTAIFFPKLSKLFDLRFFDRKATEYMTKAVQTLIEERKNKNIKCNDLLQLLIDSAFDCKDLTKISLNNKEVIDNCLTFIIGGYDTTSSSLNIMSYHLVNNPLIYEKVLKELDDNLDENEMTFEDLNKLVYLEACIYESLRLEPSSNRIERQASTDCKLGNIFVPKGTLISIPIKAVHRDPDNFENPDEFIPERFLPENKIKSCTFLTFADGPRNCIGIRLTLIEMKYCFAKLFKKYKILKCDETEPIEYHFGQLLSSPKKLVLKVEKRN